MPFPREYTPRRRWIMTAVMWLIFGATLGLAAVIGRSPAEANVVLGSPVQVGQVKIALPDDWDVRRDDIIFIQQRVVATEPLDQESASRGGGRSVAVTVKSAGEQFIQEMVYEDLMTRGVIDPDYRDGDFMIGPLKGVMMGGNRGMPGLRKRSDAGGIAVAIARIPQTEKIVRIELHARSLDRANIALLRKIAAGARIGIRNDPGSAARQTTTKPINIEKSNQEDDGR